MFALGICLGLAVAALRAIDVFICKGLVEKKNAASHSFYCIVFCIPFLMAMSLAHWKLEMSALLPVLLYGSIETINIFFHQQAIKYLNPIHAEVLSKSKTLFVYIVSLILLVESVSVKGILGIILFMSGLLITIDFSSLNYQNFSDMKGYIYEIVSVSARVVKPFVLKNLLLSDMISNEVLVLLSMIVSAILTLLVFRPELKLEKGEFKRYFFRAGLDSVSMILSGYAILLAGVLINSMVENLSIFIVAILSHFIYKKTIGHKIILGMFLVIAGLILIK